MDAALGVRLKPAFGDHGSLEKLYLDGQQIIQPWGIETADARAFFSLENGGWSNQVLVREVNHNDVRLDALVAVRMAEGFWQADLTDAVSDRSVTRRLRYVALEDTWAMDLVMRFAFPRLIVQRAEIAGHEIVWDGANYYHQYETDAVLLHLNETKLRVQLVDADYPSDWLQWMYVRCSPREDAWIVHIRLLPAKWKREIIKCRLVGARHVLFPAPLSRAILAVPGWADHLRYAGERKRRFGSRLNAYPLGFMHQETTIIMSARMDVL